MLELKTAQLFLSTPSARRATKGAETPLPQRVDFYPRPPRGGRQRLQSMVEDLPEISIHALREEGDLLAVTPGRKSPISIHALREEGDGFPCRP